MFFLQCLPSVICALKSGFLPYAPLAFQRSVNLIDQVLSLIKDTSETDSKAMLVGSIRLLREMIIGLGSDIEPLVAESNIVSLLLQCMTTSVDIVVQSSFALLGDLARTCFQHIKPNISKCVFMLYILVIVINWQFLIRTNNISTDHSMIYHKVILRC